MHKTTISEEQEPVDDNIQHDPDSICTFQANFEKDSIGSDTVCTTEMNSLHVNPGSREDFSEDTGDISGNVSSEGEHVSPRQQRIDLSTEEIQTQSGDRQRNDGYQRRKVTLNDCSSWESSVEPELNRKALSNKGDHYSQNREVTVLKRDESSSFSSNAQAGVDMNRKKQDRSKLEKGRTDEGNKTVLQQSGSCPMLS